MAATICPRPMTLTFDLEVGVGVACDLGYPCAKFCLPRPFGFRVRADVHNIRQTDDGCRSPLNAPAPPMGRGIITNIYSTFRSKDTEALAAAQED